MGETGLSREGIMRAKQMIKKQMINWYYIIHNY